MKKPVILTIIDGLGIAESSNGNAVTLANTPFLDYVTSKYSTTSLKASGLDVGLPEGQIGNSEVGHLNIGAGKKVFTGLSLINETIKNGKFEKNEHILKAFDQAINNNTCLHLMGLLSEGGVHSNEKHLFELLKLAHKKGVKKLSVHAFGDGRDVSQKSIKNSLKKLMSILNEFNYDLATIQGRVFAMDRDQNFDKTNKALKAICGKSNTTFNKNKIDDFIDIMYTQNITDEFITPAINKEATFLNDGDNVIFFNFRPDRARQLSHLLIGSKLYSEKPLLKNINLFTMMKYEGIEATTLFKSMKVENPIGKIIADNNLKQLRIAETQKYAHVTFFMDGGKEVDYKKEDKILIPSIKSDDFSSIPEMRAEEITNKLLSVGSNYDLIILNFANPDMIGHTGDLKATIKAVEFVDSQLKRIYDSNLGTMFITSDHGNSEIMIRKNEVITKHTTSDVIFCITDSNVKLKHGSLSNIAPTILAYLDIKIPDEMLNTLFL